jgi:hypothetical protein
MKRFGSARVEPAYFQASNDARDASDPFFSVDNTLINSDETWIAPTGQQAARGYLRLSGERVHQRPDDH